MKSLKIKGVETLTQKELRSIEGGSWIGRAWKWLISHLSPYKGEGVGISLKFNL